MCIFKFFISPSSDTQGNISNSLDFEDKEACLNSQDSESGVCIWAFK